MDEGRLRGLQAAVRVGDGMILVSCVVIVKFAGSQCATGVGRHGVSDLGRGRPSDIRKPGIWVHHHHHHHHWHHESRNQKNVPE